MTDEARTQEFRQLYEVTFTRVAGYVARRLSSPEDAADAVAETYLVAWRKWPEVPAGEASLYWLYATARFVLANQHRREQSRSSVVQRLADDLGRITSASAIPVDNERIEARAALDMLPPDWLEVVLLAAWEGLSADEIAAVVGCSPTAAKIRLHRARRLLAQLLSTDSPTPRAIETA